MGNRRRLKTDGGRSPEATVRGTFKIRCFFRRIGREGERRSL